MAVTRLERKGLRNKARAKARQQRIKKLTTQPPIKNIDVEAIKEEFAKKSGKSSAKKEAPKAEKTSSKEKSSEVKEKAPEAEATTSKEDKAEAASAEKKKKESSTAEDAPQAELKEPAKAPRDDAEAVEEKIENEESDEKK